MSALGLAWEWLAQGGGTLALTFIVALALGIVSLTAIYVGSAVIVLSGFARMTRGVRWILFFGACTALLHAAMRVQQILPELGERTGEWIQLFATSLGTSALLTGVAILLCWGALRLLSPARLGLCVLSGLGLAAALWLGSTGRVSVALPPPVLVGALALAFGWMRRRRSGPDDEVVVGDFERTLRWLCAVLSLGLPVALVVASNPNLRAAGIVGGQGLLGIGVALVLLGLIPLAAAGLVEMRHSVEWFIALRYLVAKRRQVFISAITAICVIGIAAGVWLIIVVLSVMNGFERTWRDEILGNRAHFTVHSDRGPFEGYDSVLERVASVDGVIGVSPYLDAEGMVRGQRGDIHSVRVRGIDPRTVGNVTDLRSDLIHGSVDALLDPALLQTAEAKGRLAAGDDITRRVSAPTARATDPGIVIGNHLAVSLGVGVGERLLLISPFGGPPTPLGPAPRLARFQIVGVYQSSFFQYDQVYTYVSLAAAQDFRRSGDVVDGIEARTTDFYRSRQVGAAVEATLGYPFYTRDWKEFFPAFFQALKTERGMMFILLTMIMVVAAFVIVATLIMMIMEKSSDIAILKAMGAEDGTIERVFAIEGTLIGVAGTTLGVVAGIAVTGQLAWIQQRIETLTGIDTLPASVYQFSTLPSEVDPLQIALVATIAMVLSLGATLLPSRQGSRLDPAEGLRYE